ncbi:hypothetical protein ACFWG0_14410 [Streptomyces yangpuensis]|uniref:hypothetical protein n=1 Tax=Streptomyces yangpuensis TaxID=1648182 RepID=UPI00364F0B76
MISPRAAAAAAMSRANGTATTTRTAATTRTATTTRPARTDIAWSEPFCSEGANCFRLGRGADGRAHIGTTGSAAYVSDSVDALRALISAVKAGAADHLLA